MSPERATPLHSPGWNEGKVRNETLGKHGHKKLRAPQKRHNSVSIGALAFWGDCATPWGLNKCISMINLGLAPWAMQEYRPKGLLYVYPIIIILDYFDALALYPPSNTPCSCAKHFLYSHPLIPFSSILRESKFNHANIHSPYEHNSRSLRTPQ